MLGDNTGDDHYECARWAANLRARPSQQGNQEACNYCAVNSRLRRQSRGNGKRHSQRQGNQANGYSGYEVFQKLLRSVVAQTKDRLRKPALLENILHA